MSRHIPFDRLQTSVIWAGTRQRTALYTNFGGPEVMKGQLDRLLAVMRLPRLSLGIIPRSAPVGIWPGNSFPPMAHPRAHGGAPAPAPNLFAVPSGAVTDISTLGATPAGWAQARQQMEPAFSVCDGVLLAYGISEPTGAARKYHREQVEWVAERLVASGCQAFQVGDGPRHPSRWQRWTSRHHRELEFSAALEASLEAVSFGRAPTRVAGTAQ